MKNLIVLALLLLCTHFRAAAQIPDVVNFDAIEDMIETPNDTTYIINFWATWCSPCVKELKYFEAVNKKYGNDKVKVVLVSLDFKNTLTSRLIPFLVQNDIHSSVMLLENMDYDNWIDKVDKSWEGNLPATLVVNNKKDYRKFIDQETNYEELEGVINEIE